MLNALSNSSFMLGTASSKLGTIRVILSWCDLFVHPFLGEFGHTWKHTNNPQTPNTPTHIHAHTQTEKVLLDTGRGPESAEDFDRLLLAHPNNSALWVQYMAFYLHTAEADRARGVAERALKTISFR